MKINTFGYFSEKDRDLFDYEIFIKSFNKLQDKIGDLFNDYNFKYENFIVDSDVLNTVYQNKGVNYLLGTLNNKIDVINLSYSKRKYDKLHSVFKETFILLDDFVIDTNNGKFNKGLKTLCQ